MGIIIIGNVEIKTLNEAWKGGGIRDRGRDRRKANMIGVIRYEEIRGYFNKNCHQPLTLVDE
jgi:hypothetical protein